MVVWNSSLSRPQELTRPMAHRSPRVDAYIEKAAPFARPILTHIRAVVHRACPEVEETIKWGMPHFEVGGILCGMAAFKAHCSLTFWNAEEVVGGSAVGGAMGEFGRITALGELPADEVLAGYVRKARDLRVAGVTRRPPPAPRRESQEIPEILAAALRQNPAAQAAWDDFGPSKKRDYAEWIAEAKREATRERRLAQAVEWISQGKPRNWKYM
jgi:hypothetical protein